MEHSRTLGNTGLENLARRARQLGLSLVLALAALSAATAQAAERISALVGSEVFTPDGQRIGQVVDLAFDLANHRVDYYVVSVGNFLIEDSLIAVAPGALTPGTTENSLTLNSDNLVNAKRFNAENWPQKADVLAASSAATAPTSSTPAATPAAAIAGTGSATISDGRRQATLAGGKQEIIQLAPSAVATSAPRPASPKPVARAGSAPTPAFRQLDTDSNGELSPAEVDQQLPTIRGHADLDLDGSGGIDRFEYDLFQRTLAPALAPSLAP